MFYHLNSYFLNTGSPTLQFVLFAIQLWKLEL